MPLIDQEKLQAFTDTVINEANDKASEIAAGAYERKQAVLEREKSVIKAELEAKYQIKIKDAQAAAAAELSRTTLDQRKEYLKVRDEIAEKTVSRARELLCEYTASEGYAEYLIKAAKSAAYSLSGRFTVYVREADLRFADAIKAAAGEKCTGVETDGTITVGGLTARSDAGGVIINETLDERLSESRNELMLYIAKYVRTDE